MLNGILEIVKKFQKPTKPENDSRRKTATQRGGRGRRRPGARQRRTGKPRHRAPRTNTASAVGNARRKRTQTYANARKGTEKGGQRTGAIDHARRQKKSRPRGTARLGDVEMRDQSLLSSISASSSDRRQ